MASLFAVLARHETPTSGRSMWWWSLQVMFKTNLMAPFCEDNHVEFCRIYYSNVKRGCRQTSKTWSVSVILVRRRVIVLRAHKKLSNIPTFRIESSNRLDLDLTSANLSITSHLGVGGVRTASGSEVVGWIFSVFGRSFIAQCCHSPVMGKVPWLCCQPVGLRVSMKCAGS